MCGTLADSWMLHRLSTTGGVSEDGVQDYRPRKVCERQTQIGTIIQMLSPCSTLSSLGSFGFRSNSCSNRLLAQVLYFRARHAAISSWVEVFRSGSGTIIYTALFFGWKFCFVPISMVLLSLASLNIRVENMSCWSNKWGPCWRVIRFLRAIKQIRFAWYGQKCKMWLLQRYCSNWHFSF